MTATPKTTALMRRGTEFLGTEHAILCGAMSWVSERNLVSAISNAGGFGVIACGAMTPELLDNGWPYENATVPVIDQCNRLSTCHR